ncbi:MAG: SUMF1/EgtB/PvdO family nonheme iron enzyme [Rhodocyclaceae bacterium]|nr:SUMF1/EgtB/PvdO family nonheme iron enzyme [Rhodocyclaceae bacterium]
MPAASEFVGRQVFVSYPRGGHAHAWAARVQARVERLGARAWRDEVSMAEGIADFADQIEQALRRADLVLAVVGEDSAACTWQKRELLLADRIGKPVVVLLIDGAELPFVVCECQLVGCRADEAATLDALMDAVRARLPAAQSGDAVQEGRAEVVPEPQRRAELDALGLLVHSHYSDREARYVPLEGHEHRSLLSAERALKSVRIDTHAVWQAFGVEPQAEQAEARRYEDVLDAYRDLPGRKVRRLAVLGEPGAGKSFSLQRIAVEYARAALGSVDAPVPVLLELGRWTRAGMSLADFAAHALPAFGKHLEALRDQGRLVLLLDAVNEIPPRQRHGKAEEIKDFAADERIAAVIVSCREKDFGELSLPFDTLGLQPLSPPQVRDFLHRLHDAMDKPQAEAEGLFWRIAGGEAVASAWRKWEAAGAGALFWTVDEIPRQSPDVHSTTTGEEDHAWRTVRFDPRNLLRIAGNPYLLQIIAALPQLPHNRAQLFRGFLSVLYRREGEARAQRNDADGVPDEGAWIAGLTALAEQLQRLAGVAEQDGAQTALPRADVALDDALLDFSRDASVLEHSGDDLRFTHQLLQEYLASHVLIEASRGGRRVAADFWPSDRWWARSGWEVVAEIAAEACAGDVAATARLVGWLAAANPELASAVWQHVGSPELAPALLSRIDKQWGHAIDDIERWPDPRPRAAAGRALGRFGLDRRPGVGLDARGLPDIAWVEIPGPAPFGYQEQTHPGLPAFAIARHPVTVAQYQAFIDASGYREERFWAGLDRRIDAPDEPSWPEPNMPRSDVSWFEAMAFCRWLSDALGEPIRLPTEWEWERAAGGTEGWSYPWGEDYRAGHANCDESDWEGGVYLGAASAVGCYPQGASVEGALDLAGNVWEWCLNEFHDPERVGPGGEASRVLRGGSWYFHPQDCRAADRFNLSPDFRFISIGFRVCRGSPIVPPPAAPPDAGSPQR